MKIIQIELPNELSDDAMFGLFNRVNTIAAEAVENDGFNRRESKVRAGMIYTSL